MRVSMCMSIGESLQNIPLCVPPKRLNKMNTCKGRFLEQIRTLAKKIGPPTERSIKIKNKQETGYRLGFWGAILVRVVQVACHGAGSIPLKLRRDTRARLEDLRTPGMERTPFWNIQRAWHLALKRWFFFTSRLKLRGRGKQCQSRNAREPHSHDPSPDRSKHAKG